MSLYHPIPRGSEDSDPHAVPQAPTQPVDCNLEKRAPEQVALDQIDEAGMESFPCSDPPSYTSAHA